MDKNIEKKSRGRPAIGKTRTFRVSDTDWEWWQYAASSQDVELSTLIRSLINDAIKRGRHIKLHPRT
jgi:Flp pilus assembly protein CpaB